MSKKPLGVFYTTEVTEIFKNIFDSFIKKYNKEEIVEPCCGNGDIVKYLNSKGIMNTLNYDIKKSEFENLTIRDTILFPVDLSNRWIITNPPFLAKNKMPKELKIKYKAYISECSDLYEIYINQIIYSDCLGGILILPSNFLFSYNNKIRKSFLEKYRIKKLKIYEKQIFTDTTSSIIVFDFYKRSKDKFDIETTLIQNLNTEYFTINLSNKNNFTYGYEIYNDKYTSDLKLSRYLNNQKDAFLTFIEVNCLDSGNGKHSIYAYFNDEPEVNKISDRTKINIVSNRRITLKSQKYIIKKFNEKIEKYRKIYHSLFMSSYREFDRKRISFDLVFTILRNIINKMNYLRYFSYDVNENVILKLCEYSYSFDFDFVLNYVLKYIEKTNINHFIKYYDTNFYIEKYYNYYERFNCLQLKYKTFEKFKNYIFDNLKNPLIQTLFIKNSIKQSIHEIIQVYIVENILKMKFERHVKDKLSKTKTFDAVNRENKIYLVCKYINECGGSQDNQINDILNFNNCSYETDYTIYLVISGKYGIDKLKEKELELNCNVKLMVL